MVRMGFWFSEGSLTQPKAAFACKEGDARCSAQSILFLT